MIQPSNPLPFPPPRNRKQVHSSKPLIWLSKATTRVPNPNFGNQTHSMVPTPENSTLLSYSANSTSDIVQICSNLIQLRSIICFLSEGFCIRLFRTHTLGSE